MEDLVDLFRSCNGLLLIKVDRRVKAQFIVCNPARQKFRALADHGGGFYESFIISLAFDPSKSPHYKVVLLHQYPPKIEIYSSETAYWKNIVIVILYEQTLCIRGCYLNGASWNGALYWLCDDRYNVLRFDVETEKIYMIPYKQRGRILPLDKTRYFGDCGCGGRLLLIQSNSHSTARFKICEMDEDCCRWNVKLPVDLKTLISEFPEIESQNFYKFTVMCVVEGEEEDDIALILAIPVL
ncbi:F-box protein At5g07610-like [Rhododendron vialii]|uniref:F-box protein At5g07610-like n=1 Tax=Rhododendron vialii TaxID=182163 RepID=UPI00265E77C0|nr:F-box protein At5g07610-like [Rhododendron vialii]